MNVSEISGADTYLDGVKVMLKNMHFWVKLMNIHSSYIFKPVKKHEIYVKAHKIIGDVSKQLLSKKIKCLDVKKLELFEKEAGVCIVDLLSSVDKSRLEDLTNAWQLSKNMVSKVEESLAISSDIVSKLKKGIKQGVFPYIPEIQEAEVFLNKKKENLFHGCIVISELDDCSFITTSISSNFNQNIHTILESELFLTLCENLVKEILEKPIEEVEPREPEEDISKMFGEEDPENIQMPAVIVSILKMFNSKGIDKYKNAWNPLFMGEVKEISEIKHIIGTSNLEFEIKCAERNLNMKFPEWILHSLQMFQEYHKYEEKVQIVKRVLNIFHIDEKVDEAFHQTMESFYALKHSTPQAITLKQLLATKRQLSLMDEIIDADFFDVLKELSKASTLVEFLRETVEEDLRQLIDSVEEHSEQFIQESTISALIDVRRFLNSILKTTVKFDKIDFVFKILEKAASANNKTSLAGKINDCCTNIHGLKSLYKHVSNRGELTKDIINNVVNQKGTKFIIQLKENGTCELLLQYKTQGLKGIQSQSDLDDLRSRALLIVNAETKRIQTDKHKQKQQKDLKLFIDSLDSVTCIAGWFEKLAQCGHPDYVSQKQNTSVSICELNDKINSLENMFNCWMQMLHDSRTEYYWLNWFFPEQLFKIKAFLTDGSCYEEVASLFEYVGCGAGFLDEARNIFSKLTKEESEHSYSLNLVGQTLAEVLKNIQHEPKYFPTDKDKSSESRAKFTDVVQERELFVAALENHSKLVIPTLLSIYKNTTGFLPLPHQVLFCSAETKWDYIYLLLQRCIRSKRPDFGKQLYCIVGVEKLSNEVQFRLVDELKQLEKDISFLAIICQGGSHHPFLDHFDASVHHVQPMTQNETESCFRNLWPHVVTVTSDVAGQGKTELIYDMADTQNLGVCTVHISGDISIKDLISRMSELNLSHDVLHIDIGVVSDTSHLDLLLFQLIILGFLVDGSSLFKLPTQNISIEIANSINNVLRNSLQTTMCFIRKHLQWEHFTNFKIGQEISSAVQVVCCYLNSKEKGTLDTEDLYLSGVNGAKCLPAEKCKDLLRNHFSPSSDLSFSVVNIFLSVLADQLKKLSSSMFFRSSNLSAMLGEKEINNVKSTLVRALLEFSTEFSTRSVQACREEQVANVSQLKDTNVSAESTFSTSATAASMTKRVENMIQWAESNHLIVTFHNSDIQTLSALYRDKSLVPKHIKDLFEMQVRKPLPDFCSLKQKQLQEILQRIARSRPGELPEETLDKLGHDYALTPDNLLKMILIILRIEAHVPIIIMGETGCGKTSLICYLATVCDVDLHIQNIHAGTVESIIIKSVMDANAKARSNLDKPVWMFLDEINTCNHLGLINDIICHHRCQDITLAPNLVLMAACNPYRLRNENSILTAGLTMKVKTDEQSKLVYRVNPLPETMVDYVWDYGTLSEEDEKSYIQRMVGRIVSDKLTDLLVQLLVMSQNFIKKMHQNETCVSLRDVSRCKRLIGWFKMTLKSKYQDINDEQCEINSIILALAHSYHSRLATTSERNQYRKEMYTVFKTFKSAEVDSESDILNTIVSEQKDILERMDLPEGTATNTALQENVFVIMVCILNRIPIFVVGKPGCSKSLSLQLIKSNLRGKDSEDEYFRKLPQLYCVSYQGSESSTSDGIIKVFDKAKQYRKHNKEDDVLPVVILDEIGLAEVSRFNPLKVLHSLLEPGDTEVPDVAVVGISNWALDAAKMNRAIHLSRPDMDEHELYMTGVSISEASAKDNISSSLLSINEKPPSTSFVGHDLLKAIASAYVHYTDNQMFSHFHGLRDYYSLVKYISSEFRKQTTEERHPESVMIRGLLRNFGGLPSEQNSVVEIYKEHLKNTNLYSEESFPKDTDVSVVSLIKENISDPGARHLLVTTCGDSALSIIESVLHDMDREYELIMGSQFEEDLTDDYNYRILSRIILCMEQGIVLILKDLDSIYGSLYDMLNQNYTIVGKKKNCRIAHGAYSNPLCQVHDKFRCIVLVDEGKLHISDPPFLNRFEKQNVRLASILTEEETKLVEEMNTWLGKVTSVEGFSFTEKSFVPIFTPDMLSSLVHCIVSVEEKSPHEFDYATTYHDDFPIEHSQMFHSKILTKCKDTLLQVCSPDGIIRMGRSVLSKEDDFASDELKEKYFHLPLHDGLGSYVHDLLLNHSDELHKLIVFTHSNLHTNIGTCLKSVSSRFQIEKLSTFKSEKQLSHRVHNFWLDTDDEWLIIQCSSQLDMMNFLLMKSTVEKHRSEYMNLNSECRKNVIIVIHLDREHDSVNLGSINFISGWILAFIDKIECSTRPLTDLLDKTLEDLIKEQRPLTSFVSQHLFWAFSCIGYSKGYRTMASLKDIITKVTSSEEILRLLEELMVQFVYEKQQMALVKQNWQLDVACNLLKLYRASTLHGALEQEIDNSLKPSLAALVYQIELNNAWDVLLIASNNEKVLTVWKQCVTDRKIINIVDIPVPVGPQCYPCPCLVTSLQYPFVYHFLEKIANLKHLFMENLRSCKIELAIDDDDVDNESGDDLNEKVKNDMCRRLKGIIKVTVAELFQYEYLGSKADYFTAFCSYIGALQTTHMSEEHKHKVIMLTIKPLQNNKDVTFLEVVTEIHVIYWLHESYIMSSLNLVDACLRVTDMSFENLLQDCFANDICQNCVCIGKPDSVVKNTDVANVETTVTNTTSEYIYAVKNSDLGEDSDDTDSSVKNVDDYAAKNTDFDNDSELFFKNTDSNAAENTEYASDTSHSVESSSDVQCFVNKEQMSRYRLVTYSCRLLIPSMKMASSFCIEEWQHSVSLVLSLSSEVSLEPEILQVLRVCSDFAALITVPYKLPNDFLLELGENILSKGLDSDDFLCYLFSVLGDIRKQKSNSESVLQHFLTCYLSSCLSANPDSNILTCIFEHLKTGLLDEAFSFFGPTLHQALFMEVSNGLDILNDEHCVDNEFIQILNTFLLEMVEQDGASNLATLVMDVLFHYFIKPARLFQTDGASDSAVIKEMLKCQSVFLNEDKLTYKTLAAVAFLKAIITSFSNVLTNKHINLDQYSFELQQIASVFQPCENDDTDKNKKVEALQKMLLRCLVKGDGLKRFDEVKQIVSEVVDFPKTEIETEQRLQLFEHNPCRKHGEQERTAFDTLKSETTLMNVLLESASESPQFMMRIYSFVIHQLYLVQSVRSLTDTERTLSQSFINCCKERSLSPKQVNLLECLCVTKDFAFPPLQISSTTDSQTFSMMSVLVHFFSTVTAYYSEEMSSVFGKCLQSPTELNLLYLFSCPDKNVGETFTDVVSGKHSVAIFCDCSCSFVTAITHGSGEMCITCSACKNHFSNGQKQSKPLSVQNTLERTHGYSCFLSDLLKNHLITVRRLSPIAFRILTFLLHGCFSGSLALNNATTDDLTKLLNLPDGIDLVNYLTEHLNLHWKALKTLTFFGDAQLCKFLHTVIEDQQDLLLRSTSKFLNEKEREEFEIKFDLNISQLVENRFAVIQQVLIAHSKDADDNSAVEFEKTLEDICNEDEMSKGLAKLFRITSTPSIDNLQVEFLNSKRKSLFPFLGLVFEKIQQLRLLSDLLPLVQWHLSTVRYLSHNIKRAKSHKTTLQAFIYKSEVNDDEESKKALQKAYDVFIKSWNRLKNHLSVLQSYNSEIINMERLDKESNLAETIVMDDTSPLLQVMTALQKMQNEFLDDAVIISLCLKCHSTSFLKKSIDSVVIPRMNLENITERDIISNPLDEDLLKFSQCNTDPGCGLQRDYDFYQIEMQVADTCLINKSYLKIGANFPKIIFAGEMLRMSKTLFDEIRKMIEQKPLDKDLEKSVFELKGKNPGNLQGLLSYLEMAFSLLTRNPLSRQDVDQNLTDLLQQWQSMIAVQIPAVTNFCSKVHLCHVIALYEFVELLMADIVIESLEEKYNKPIPEDCTENLQAVVHNASILLLETIICALKRFSFRYLSTSSLDAKEGLSPCLMDATLWPNGIVQRVSGGTNATEIGILTPHLAIEHTVSTIQFFMDALEVSMFLLSV